MELFVGLDVSPEKTAICVISLHGKITKKAHPEHLLHCQCQAIDTFAEVHRPGRHEDLHRTAMTEHHDAAARAARIARVS